MNTKDKTIECMYGGSLHLEGANHGVRLQADTGSVLLDRRQTKELYVFLHDVLGMGFAQGTRELNEAALPRTVDDAPDAPTLAPPPSDVGAREQAIDAALSEVLGYEPLGEDR